MSFAGSLTTNQMLLEGTRTEDRILLQTVRSSILERAGRGLKHPLSSNGIDWQELGTVAKQNRLEIFLLRGLEQGAVHAPQKFRALLEERRDATVRLNTRNLLTVRRVLPLLEAQGVSAVVFKGPCAQMLVHGEFFAKPSLDVDLLVRPADFDKASRVICDDGFALAEECSSVWWRIFLGEQAFLSRDRLQSAVDLHHRVQQPGCPAPRESELFLSQSVTIDVGSTRVRTLSRTNATLLSCMSLAKALIQREPAGGHVFDVAAWLARNAPSEMAELVETADKQGLRHTLALGLRAAGLLFGVQAPIGQDRARILADIADANLIKMILRPWASEIAWPRRSTMLRELCETRAAYLKEIGWKLAAEICRNLCQRPTRHRRSRPGEGPVVQP